MSSTTGSRPAAEASVSPPDTERPQAHYDAIKTRFAEARDLRLKYRPQGTAQYTSDLTGDLAHYQIDPHAGEPEIGRAHV